MFRGARYREDLWLERKLPDPAGGRSLLFRLH